MHRSLLDNSIQAMLAAIEVYNKPNFNYREQVFVMLVVNAWELLLKSKILCDNDGDLTSIYVYRNDEVKIARSGNPMTIEVKGAINQVGLDPAVATNLETLIEVRDTVVHFFHDDSLSYLVFTLGVANLRNYQSLVQEWFNKSLSEYNFYILPLAFAYNFQTLSVLELEDKPEAVANIIRAAADTQTAMDEEEEFYFVCEIATQLQSAKRFTGEPGFVTVIDSEADPETPIVVRPLRRIDQYPVTYSQLWTRVKKIKPWIKQTEVNYVIKSYGVKDNPDLSCYFFRTRQHEEMYEKTGQLPNGITSLYNENAVRFILEHTSEKPKDETK